MAGWSAVSVALGAALLTATLLDILITTLHPAAESPLSARFYRTLWRLVRILTVSLPAGLRRRLLNWLFPASIAGLLLLWLLLLLCGFALLYAPFMGRPGAFRSAGESLRWTDAFYFSGTCVTSFGFGDIVPRWALLRLAAVGEGICGLLGIAVAVTYVLSVFPVLPTVRVLASILNEEADGSVDALPLVLRYLSVGAAEVLAARCRELASQLTVLSEAHTSHPVLFYVHPRHVEESFLRSLLVTQRLVALLRYGLRAADHPNLIRDPRVVGLEESLIAALRRMGASLHLKVQPPDAAPMHRQLAQEHLALLERLRGAGLRDDAQASQAERRAFIRFRLVTDPYIEAYWANSGYPREEVWGDHPPLRAATAPLPEEDEEG